MTEDQITRNLVQVAHSGEMTFDQIPTQTIKKCKIETSLNTDTIRSSYVPQQGKVGLLTYLHLETNIEKTSFALVDRNGTFDHFQLGTAIVTGQVMAKILQGDWKRPLHVIKGTFSLYNTSGSYTGGSFVHAWEVVLK